ncbi:acetyltransferase [Kibdelosporangium banguiense]|uniref:Acetyltransferase n=1 Tax=Kibdelosporangium banguiense TaxID=1365924 RepID=A0ABS4T8F0_9PSEU|nr:acetate--CoA ligase family protein [Kibdelosporangium banguiense]MBP2320375.1 acetyltransferase [Kibdelosporangium banguiense]
MTGTLGLGSLFAPRGIAVIGASRNQQKLGAAMVRSLRGFADHGGHLALVNARDDSMHRSVRAAAQDGPVDLVMLCVPAAVCADVLTEAADAGVRAAVVCGGGFAEAGGSGIEYQEQLVAVAAGTGVRVLGPNTSGFLVPNAKLTASFVPGAADVRAGKIAVVAASGGVNHALSFLLTQAGHGVSLAVGLGNAIDVGAPDVLDYLADDPATSAVALHIESVADGPRLVESVARLSARRPVVALVVGKHDIGAFAASHTGALATSWRTTRAALAQAGAVLVDNERDLVDAVGALAVQRLKPNRDPAIGVVTAQAGPGLLILDDLRGRGTRIPELHASTQDKLAELLPPLTFQRNPVDTGRPGPTLGDVFRVVADDPEVDLIAGYALHEPDAADLPAALTNPGVPVVMGLGGTGAETARCREALLAAGIAVASEPRGVAAGIAALREDARARTRRFDTEQRLVPTGIRGPLDEDQAKTLLERIGIRTPARRACADRAEAHQALAALGGPVAVKILDATVLHKTDIGGVHLGVGTPEDLDKALASIGSARYLVEEMAPPGVDLVLGAHRDPIFGPTVLFGLGGTAAEALADVAIRLAPLSAATAAEMPEELAGRALLDGWRGGPVLNAGRLGLLAAALGDLLAANPDLAEIEINPLRLTVSGLVALDAVVLSREASDAHPHQ